jgi:hypothetical protein
MTDLISDRLMALARGDHTASVQTAAHQSRHARSRYQVPTLPEAHIEATGYNLQLDH